MTTSANNPHTGASAVRCLLLAPAGAASNTVAALEAALRSRGLEPERCRDAYDAMARAVEHERARRDADEQAARPLALILAEPARLDRPDTLAAAVEKHVRGVTVWRYDHAATPALRLFEKPATHTAQTASPNGVAPPGPSPSLRLTGFHDRPTPAPAEAPPNEPEERTSDEPHTAAPSEPHAADAASLLSEEELRMLLSEDPLPPERALGWSAARRPDGEDDQ